MGWGTGPPRKLLEYVKMSTNQTRKETLKNLVISMLNENYETLGKFGDLEEFIDIVVETTEDWCLECYHDNEFS